MLVALATLALIGSIILPCLARACRMSQSVRCKGNLHHLGVLLHTESDRTLGLDAGPVVTIPGASRWTDFVARNRMTGLLLCPSDETPHDMLAGLRHLYVRQDGGANSLQTGVRHTNLADLLAGREMSDEQVYYNYRGATNGSARSLLKEPVPGVPGAWRTVRRTVGWQWVYDLNGGREPGDDQAMVAIETCAALLITLADPWIEIRPLGRHPQSQSGSAHWVCKGNPYDADGWESDVLVRLTGAHYDVVNPPIRIYGGKTSYGMSNLVPVRNYSLEQIWLMEYTHDMVDMTPGLGDEPFDDDPANGEVLARHLGRTNLIRVDGGVSSYSLAQLADECGWMESLAMGR